MESRKDEPCLWDANARANANIYLFKILKTNYNVALHMYKLWVLRVIKH